MDREAKFNSLHFLIFFRLGETESLALLLGKNKIRFQQWKLRNKRERPRVTPFEEGWTE